MNQGLWRYADWMEPVPPAARLTLGEGGTPLVRSRRLGPAAGLKNLFFKLEFTNPTGSYKDRFACAAVSDMVANGKTECIATSSGNTGAALAAYCALAGITCEIAIVEKAPEGKLRQMLAYGAKLYRVKNFGVDSETSDRVVECLKKLSSRPQAQMQISAFAFSPVGMSGVYGISHEMAEQIDGPIDHVFCMAGGGGFVLAIARGFQQLVKSGRIERTPRIECVQPEGNDTIAGPLKAGSKAAVPVECTSRISGLQVPQVIDGDLVIEACRQSGGTGHLVTDEWIYEVQSRLAREEGLFAEPAGSTAVAGVLKAAREGLLDPNANIVCVISGSAFKDPNSLEAMTRNSHCPMIALSDLEARVEKEV
ncbi:pyridoxal-phosphate dependent enzyme [Schlesneria sp.]|uniref:pyridoxal-phosphate dependent enzyme n=1 Tax=Schlesneria sp. TaxID=2762018 RepID=UPI002F09802E